MNWHRLKKLRIAVSAAVLLGLTLALVGGSSPFLAKVGGWLASAQFVPSVLALTAGASISLACVLILVVTLLVGRVYCSTLCPLGALQDVILRLRSLLDKKKKSIPYAKPVPRLRAAVLVLVLFGVVSGWTGLVLSLLDPYSNFGRIVSELVRPLLQGVLRFVPGTASTKAIIGIHSAATHWAGLGAILVPVAVLALVIFLAATRGRIYCNTICPVGALLGLISRHAAFQLQLDVDCRKCGKCARACKAQCIDTRTGNIDNSRCVSCLNCVPVCADSYIGYRLNWRKKTKREPLVTLAAADNTEPVAAPSYRRRAVMTTGALALVGAVGSELLWAGYAKGNGTAGGKLSATATSGDRAVRPPGSTSLEAFLDRCTACHLCVSACPTQVLQPSFLHDRLSGLLKPRMNFSGSYCDDDCNRCGQVCPSGALTALSLADKRRTRVGLARFDASRCVVQTKGIICTKCIDNCPAKAIGTIPFGDHLRLPQLKALQCIGCGRCEYECPVSGRKAITVSGLLRETHVPVGVSHENAGALANTERIGS